MANIEQPTGYNFEIKGKLVKEHECPICLMLIRNATELPCSHLMCRDCLVYYEEKELERNENAIFVCSLCQAIYERNQKKAVRSTDRTIRESLEVKCKNWKDECGWVGSISDYENHHFNVCEFLSVECPNNGCMEQRQRRAILAHQDFFCEYRIVPCEHCQGEFPICWLMDHHKTCPSYPVTCKNSCCKELVQRKQMDDHCKNECQHQIIPCLYYEVGCTIQFPRHAMTNHQQEAMQHHSILLLKSHVDLSKKNQDLEKQLKKSNESIEKLQETVMKQEEAIETQQAEITSLQNDVKKHEELVQNNDSEIKLFSENFTNLKKFAKQSANLLQMISKIKLVRPLGLRTLHQKDYEKTEVISKLKSQEIECGNQVIDCSYLQALGKAFKLCHEVNFPATYEERLIEVSVLMEKDVVYRRGDVYYLKTDCYRRCEFVSLDVYNEVSSFEQAVDRNFKLKRQSIWHASHFDYTMGCLNMAFLANEKIKEVWLLHNKDEKQSMKLYINDKTLIALHAFGIGTSFILKMNF